MLLQNPDSHTVKKALGSILIFGTAAAVAIYVGISLSHTHTTATPTVTVNVNLSLQEIDGFGISQIFESASQFQSLDSIPQRQALDYLFSTTAGAGLTIIRNRIGSGGVNDSILPTSPGSPSGTPHYVWNRNDSGQVWFSQQAMSYGVKTIYADAWSAPGFMKTNGNQTNGGYLCGVAGETCPSGDWRQAYANMLVQYVKYYEQEGVNITHLGFLNDPDYSYVSRFQNEFLLTLINRSIYPSMLSNAQQAASFIPTLYDTLQSNNLSNVAMTCCDASGWPATMALTSSLVSAGMERYLKVITSHMYTGDPDSVLSTNLKVWETDGAPSTPESCTTWYNNGSLCEGMTWANKIATGILNANLSAYLYLDGVEATDQQSSSYLVFSDSTNVTPSGRLWAFAMWSRFIRPGAYRVSTSGTISGVAIGAFKNTDGTIVVVLTNPGSSAQSITLAFQGFSASSATAYLTDNSHQVATTMSVSVSSGAEVVSVPAYSVVTVVFSSGNSTSHSTGIPTISPTSHSSTSRSVSSITTPPPSSTSTSEASLQTQWGQCGGIGWEGAIGCQPPFVCITIDPWYAQCENQTSSV